MRGDPEIILFSKFMWAMWKKLLEGRKEITRDSIFRTFCSLREREEICGGTRVPKRWHDLEWLINPEDGRKLVEAKWDNNTTRWTAYKNIMAGLRTMGASDDVMKRYNDLKMKCEETIKDRYENGAKTERQEESWMSWADVLKHRDEYLRTNNKPDHELLLSLYTMIPPVRSDYHDMEIVARPECLSERNAYVVSEKHFMFQNYKTDKTYGTVYVDAPPELVEVIERLRPLGTSERRWMFATKNGTPFQGPRINGELKTIFGKNVGPSLLRSIYITEKYPDRRPQMREDAKQMMTSVNLIRSVYSKS